MMEETKIGMNYSMEGIGGVREKAPDNSSTPAPPGTETAALDYPSMEGKGFEEVTVPRPPLFRGHLGMFYESHDPGFENLALRDTVPYVTKSINEAFKEGNYGILQHYAKGLEESGVLDPALIPKVKAFVEEAAAIKTPEEGAALLNRVNLFLGGLRMTTREKLQRKGEE